MTFLEAIKSDQIDEKTISKYIPRNSNQIESYSTAVNKILQEVKNNGNKAIIKFTKEFDEVDLNEDEIPVSEDEITTAYSKIDPNLLKAIQYAKKNLKLSLENSKFQFLILETKMIIVRQETTIIIERFSCTKSKPKFLTYITNDINPGPNKTKNVLIWFSCRFRVLPIIFKMIGAKIV